MQYILSLFFAAIGAAVFFQGFKLMRKHRLIKDIPRSKIRAMAMGLVEIHGKIRADELIKSPFSQTDCVFYKYEIKELKRRSSGSGKNRRTRLEWVAIATGDRRIPFFAEDETGTAMVDPTGAEFNTEIKRSYHQDRDAFSGISDFISTIKNWDSRKEQLLDVSGLELKPIEAGKKLRFSKSAGDRRYHEYYLQNGDTLFLMGTAASSSEAPGNVVLKKGENEPTFIISDKSEKGTLKALKGKMITAFALGGVTFIAGVLVFLHLIGVI